MENAAKGIKKVALELGGKSPNIILDDADLKTAVARGMIHMAMNTGQSRATRHRACWRQREGRANRRRHCQLDQGAVA